MQVEFFLQKGADVNIKTSSGDTALHNAVSCPETVELLLKYGADFNILDEKKKTALYLAATSELSETVKLLVKAGADVNVVSSDGATLLDSLFEVKIKKLGITRNEASKLAINKKYEATIKALLQSYSLEISNEEHKNEVVKVLKKCFLPALKNMPVYKSGNIAISTAFNDELRDAVEISRANFKTVAKVVDESISIADINISDIITGYTDDIDLCPPDHSHSFDTSLASAAAASSVDVVGASSGVEE